MTHEPGFYWVWWYEGWHVAEYDGINWFLAGFEDFRDPSTFSQILGPILPPEHT